MKHTKGPNKRNNLLNKVLGRKGEDLATKYLKSNGFNIILNNYYRRVGEIDIIAVKNNIIHFIEVKTVSRETYFDPNYHLSMVYRPEIKINSEKMFHMKQAIKLFIAENELFDHLIQVDVITITFYKNQSKPTINLIENIQLV